ncbi:hypothetical protein T265_04342 [Opisthorchis viverrini]|uniref:Uncharacterized protein n=1 Tax=Opisthorchis viverrini TaxID=6198 RepID=A0A075AGQ7_OPIVI|nr:hypothetical protein T265_04342 [Opisthorchis viverrini]KER28964.1 hypothetical protein T265_04342 [Opisthorchis viverrini]
MSKRRFGKNVPFLEIQKNTRKEEQFANHDPRLNPRVEDARNDQILIAFALFTCLAQSGNQDKMGRLQPFVNLEPRPSEGEESE